jgi:hypothetical protein
MRKFLILAPVLIAACSTAPAEIPVHGVTPGHKCVETGTERFIGQQATTKSGGAIKHISHAAVLRWAPPRVMLTMDYREDRVTVWFDDGKKITKIRCG